MKKLIKASLVMVMAFCPLIVEAQEQQMNAEEAEQLLIEYAQEKAQACPVEEEKELYLIMMGYEDHQMNVVYSVSHENYEMGKNNQNLLRTNYIEEMKKNKEKRGMATLLTIADSSLALIFLDQSLGDDAINKPLTIAFSEDELKSILQDPVE
ncbi:hypothetical protein [Bacteroides heparinolyticus]